MRITQKCTKDTGFVTGFICLVAFSLFLLCTDHYFSLPDLSENWYFGLTGIEEKGDFSSYSAYSKACPSLPAARELCPFLSDLRAGGLALECVLGVTLVLEIVSTLHICLMNVLLTQTIRAVARGSKVSEYVQALGKVLTWVQYVTLIEPLVNVGGVICWPVQSRFPDLSQRYALHAEAGLIVLVLKTGVSLVLHALLLLNIAENRRKNARMLEERRPGKSECCVIESEKSMSGGVSIDETRL